MRIDLANLGTAIQAGPELKKLKESTTKLEGVFVKQLLEQMEKGTKAFGDGPGAQTYQDFFNQAIADSAAKKGSLGIGSILYRQLSPRVYAQIAQQNKTNKS